MNWQAISFDWNQVRAFLATAEEGSLSAAARALNSTQPTLGRQVSALEEALGVTLFERSGRHMQMTSAGHELLDHVRAMGDAASRISMVASGQSQDIAGKVSITASDLFAVGVLPALVARLRDEHPALEIEIISSNKLEDLTRRDADIAIRHVRPEQPDLIARKVCEITAAFVASSAYLQRFGRPLTPSDLAQHTFVGPRDDQQFFDFMQARGTPVDPARMRYRSDSGVVLWEMVRAGLGISVLPRGLWPETRDVEEVLTDLPPLTFPVWLVTHRELRTNKRIRVVFDALDELFSKELPQLR